MFMMFCFCHNYDKHVGNNLWYWHLAASHQTSQQTQRIKGQTSLGLIRKPHNEQAVNSLQLPLWDTRASDHTELLNLIKLFSRTMRKHGSVSGMLSEEESSL